MPTIKIAVKNKIAASPVEQLVCGNSDYQIEFAFDEEWDSYPVKTARFIWNGQYADVVFEGNICPAPVISGASVCAIGAFAGDLHTTTPALVTCVKSILCGSGSPAAPAPDVYAQIMELLNKGGTVPADGSGVVLTDRKTAKKYVLYVSDGKLMMQESEA